MPIYEYQCSACAHRLEALQKMADAPLVDCPNCDQPALIKLVSAASFKLKGSGWYETDFKNKGAASEKGAASPQNASSEQGAASQQKAASEQSDRGEKNDAGRNSPAGEKSAARASGETPGKSGESAGSISSKGSDQRGGDSAVTKSRNSSSTRTESA